MASTLALGGCVSLETTAPPVAALTARGKDPALLESGRRIYLENCTRCHVAEPVRNYAVARWPGIIADMGERSRLTTAQHDAVLGYVLAAAQAR